MRNLSKIIITILIFINSQANAQIFEKDYFSIFSKYKITDKTKVQKIVNFCVSKLGKNNIKITKNNDGEVIIRHKKENLCYFLFCNNEILLLIFHKMLLKFLDKLLRVDFLKTESILLT